MTDAILLTEIEAAELMRLSTRTLRKARQDGHLHYVSVGRSVRYTVADLESYVERLRQVQPACSPIQSTHRKTAAKGQSGTIISFTERNVRR